MYSHQAIEVHFWVATIGIVFYAASMWMAGVMQGLMWRSVDADGTLTYSFVEALAATFPYYVVRFLGGALYLAGMVVMAWNTYMTMRFADADPRAVNAPPVVPVLQPSAHT